MIVDEIRKYCLSFPDATENLQWGDDLCFKIRGKIFAILGLTAVPQKMCFKCSPESFAELVEREDIHPAPYVGRYKWVMLDHLSALRTDELKDLIRRSYEMVAAKAPKSKPTAPRLKKTSLKKTSGKKTSGKKTSGKKKGTAVAHKTRAKKR
jgi:predicted DNA-binding protein (MmcQ/YjbR family)